LRYETERRTIVDGGVRLRREKRFARIQRGKHDPLLGLHFVDIVESIWALSEGWAWERLSQVESGSREVARGERLLLAEAVALQA
jgi:hypothetical protein